LLTTRSTEATINYYEHHLGDYMRDTAHLSLLEDGAYRRLLDAYYTRERPLPPDLRDCCKLARASTKPERDAVAYVLRVFFEQRDDGYHQKRADEEIARYREAEPEREAKRTNERERQQRTRTRRKELFDTLRAAGVVPPYDTPMAELQALASRLPSRVTQRDITDPVTRDATATHTQTPDTRNTKTTVVALATPLPRAPDPGEDSSDPPPSPPTPTAASTRAAAATLAMRAAGLADANPAHPTLLALVQAGVTDAELADAAALAVGKGKGFAYALAVAEGRRRDAANTAAAVAGTPRPVAGASPPAQLSFYERDLASKRRQWEQMTGRIHPDNLPQQPPPMGDVIDITPSVPLLAKGAP
jgi:uncharacterized protein YdaU (DUF1376 family)